MGAQSLVIGKMFGEGFQYGKRKISAMPNEEFNKLTFEAMMSNARDEMQASIPTMIQAMQDMKPMVTAVVHEFTNYLSLVLEAAPEEAEQVISSAAHALAPHDKPQIPSGHTEELNIFETVAEQFPHLHEAGAVDMTTTKTAIPLTDTSRPSTVKGKTIAQARAQAAARQAEYERQQREKKKFSLALAKTKQPTAQISIIQQGRGKKKAGQSQIMERKKLVKQIASIQGTVKQRLSSSPSLQRQQKNSRGRLLKLMRGYQQQLVNLLTRYRF